MTYGDARDKVTGLKDKAEKQKKNVLNKADHHGEMTDGLCKVSGQIDELEREHLAVKKERDALDQKRRRAMSLVTEVITRLEQGFLDGSSGQALQLARFARSELEP